MVLKIQLFACAEDQPSIEPTIAKRGRLVYQRNITKPSDPGSRHVQLKVYLDHHGHGAFRHRECTGCSDIASACTSPLGLSYGLSDPGNMAGCGQDLTAATNDRLGSRGG
jgi:hypothetical protein